MTADTPDKSLLQLVSRVIDTLTTDNRSYDTLISILSLICLVSILNRNQNQAVQTTTPMTGNPLQKILGELTKGDGGGGSGPSPDMLMSLLPLLNSPQLKSKLNPSNISTIMSLVNSLGGSGTDKSDSAKPEKPSSKVETRPEETPAAAVTASANIHAEKQITDIEDGDKKGMGRYLNWKTNF